MSTGLMSCVRENSPPLEMAASESGAVSLPPSTSDQQKRRRFHPLRNLRRIFRRRTLANADATTATSSPTSSMSQMSTSPTNVIASGSAHATAIQSNTQIQTQSSLTAAAAIETAADTETISATTYYYKPTSQPVDVTTMSSTTTYPSHMSGLSRSHGVGSCGVASIITQFSGSPSASSGYFIKDNREYGGDALKLNPKGEEEDDAEAPCDLDDSREMTDYQRSFSEGRLVESEFNRDALSQSHDSVFSESATASSLSIVLKAELFDVLRKRRNRPDASDEDLGLPHSPTTPQRKEHTINQSEGSLSLLSIGSSEMDDESGSNYGAADKTISSISSKLSQDASKTSDEIDLDLSIGSRLSHSAARHKMAVRPKKKGPTRHRRPIESTILPSTPEVNEEVFKISSLDMKDSSPEKTKSHSLPPGVNSKSMEQHSTTKTTKDSVINIKRSKTETSGTTLLYSNKKLFQKNTTSNSEKEQSILSSNNSTLERKEDEGGFFRRLLHRNSKKNKKSGDECDRCDEHSITSEETKISELSETISQKMEDTRSDFRKEFVSESKSGLSSMLNTYMLSSEPEDVPEPVSLPKHTKPKSGAAARQRIVPKDLTSSPVLDRKTMDRKETNQFLEQERTVEYLNANRQRYPVILTVGPSPSKKPDSGSKMSLDYSGSNEDVFYESRVQKEVKSDRSYISKVASEEILIPKIKKRSIDEQSSQSVSPPKGHWSFEKKDRVQPKIVGLSPFQHKMSKLENANIDRPLAKPRKVVEKSKSFRYYSDSTDENDNKHLKRSDNMPSLPDLTQPRKCFDDDHKEQKKLPMGFEINDNNLIKLRSYEEEALPLSQGIYTKNIILTTTKASQSNAPKSLTEQNITEIEENIDKLVKSPFVTVLKKTIDTPEIVDSTVKTTSNSMTKISITPIRKTEFVEKREVMIETSHSTTNISDFKIGGSRSYLDKIVPVEKTDVKEVEKPKVSAPIVTPASAIATDKTKVSVEEKPKPPLFERRTLSESNDSKTNTPTKARRSSSIFEKTSESVPEFMKIQLNRVDSGRPKSHIVLSKNTKESESQEITRRFSNENVEITDNKPPLPPDAVGKRSSVINITKSQEFERPKSPVKKVCDSENNVLRNTENTQSSNILADRRKPVTDEKFKYEKKIEDFKSEKKKIISEEVRKSAAEEDTGVVLRKKSFAAINNNQTSSNKEDTPELMKVFARRSLKIKDTDEQQSFEEIEKTTNSLKRTANIDSDKENQSSSEEKLDKLPKVEITIQTPKTTIQNGLGLKNEDKNRSSIGEIVFRKPAATIITATTTTTTKPFLPPSRFGNVTNYRNTTAFIETRKQVTQSIVTPTSPATTPTNANQVSEPNNNNTSNNNNNNNNNNVSSQSSNVKNSSIRNTISGTVSLTQTATTPSEASEEIEFKGILQRRAEWEKRAKEASK